MARPVPRYARSPGKPRIRLRPAAPSVAKADAKAPRKPAPSPEARRPMIFTDWASI